MSEEKRSVFSEDLKSLLVANPFTRRGLDSYFDSSNQLSEKDFFENYYVPLISENNDGLIQFENDAANTSKSILSIMGASGSGKTTYLNYLRYKLNSNNLLFHIIDMSSASSKRTGFLRGIIDVSNRDFDEFGMLVVALSKYISTLLSYESDNPNKIIDSYREWTQKINILSTAIHERVGEFFSVLETSVSGENAEADQEFGTKLAAYLNNIFISSVKKEDVLRIVIQIILCIWVSLSRYGKRHICAIDNIEALLFVNNSGIENSLIKAFIENLYYINDEFKATIMNSMETYRNLYSFILATRTNTFISVNAEHTRQQLERTTVLVIDDIGFDSTKFEQIIKKRIDSARLDLDYDGHFDNNEYIDFFSCVLNDKTKSKWSMSTIVTKLCNNNYRRVVRLLIDVISKQPVESIVSFSEKWKQSTNNNDKEAKHSLRKVFLKMVLDYCRETENTADIVDANDLEEIERLFSTSIDYDESKGFEDEINQQTHNDKVNSAVYSADGQRLLSASFDKTIREWDIKTGKCIRIFRGHSSHVNSAVYSNDKRRILSASTDNTIREWDIETGKCLHVYEGHSDAVYTAVYSIDGRLILSASSDGTVREWDRNTVECLRVLQEHNSPVNCAIYSNDGQFILSVSFDGTIKKWDCMTGALLQTLSGHGYYVNSVMSSKNGKNILSASSDFTIREWDTLTGDCLRIFEGHSSSVYSAVYSDDEQKILTASKDNTIREWNRQTGECLRILEGHVSSVYSAVYSPDGLRILSASADNTIREWDIKIDICLCVYGRPRTEIDTVSTKKKYFISYNHTNKDWALWIAEVLEEHGQIVLFPEKNISPEDDFVSKMAMLLQECDVCIPVISRAYLESPHCREEWTSVYGKAAKSKSLQIVPVRVSEAEPDGLLYGLIYIDLNEVRDEATATEKLLEGMDLRGIKPKESGSINGTTPLTKAMFPGAYTLPINNLPARNVYFSGRVGILNDISTKFSQSNTISIKQTITGLGGIGKTQTALEYVYRFGSEYTDAIWWIRADTGMAAFNGVLDFAETFGLIPEGLDEARKLSPEQLGKLLRVWCSAHHSWLFVFDNVEYIDDIAPYLSVMQTGHILITTRNRKLMQGESVNIDFFSHDEAAGFMRTRLAAYPHLLDDEAALGTLTDRLGYYPLALEQAAAYMKDKDNNCDCVGYLRLFDKHGLEVFKASSAEPLDYHAIVSTTWHVSIDKVSKPARQLLSLCAYMAPDKIPLDFFRQQRNVFPEPLCNQLMNDFTMNEVVQSLSQYALSERVGDSLSVHRLVQQVIREQVQDDETDWLGLCLDAMIAGMPKTEDYSRPEPRKWFAMISAHADIIVSYAEYTYVGNDENENKTALLCHQLAIGYDELAQYSQALGWYQEALSIREKVLGMEHPDTAATYSNIALVYDSQGYYAKALEWHQKALAVQEKMQGMEHPNTAATYNNIALVYYSQGDYLKALEWYQKALTIRESVLGKEHPDTAATYNNIAFVYSRQGDYPKALEWYQKALAICEKVLGKEHPDTAATYNNVALVYYSQGDYLKAFEWYQKALAIRENVLGKEHPDTATTYDDIASIYDKQGDYLKALEWYRMALAIREKALGKEHPDTATTYNNIAGVYNSQDDYPKALEWYQKALLIRESMLGRDHPDTATTYSNMADVYNNQGDLSKALELYRKAISVFEIKLGKDHHATLLAYKVLSELYTAIEATNKETVEPDDNGAVFVNILSAEESLKSWEKRTLLPSDETVKTLFERLGFYSLALEQAISYIVINNISPAEYLAIAERRGLVPRENGLLRSPDKVIEVTWKICAVNLSKAAKQFLYLCAYLATDNLTKQINLDFDIKFFQHIRDELTSDLESDEIIAELTEYSILKREVNNLYSLHPFVQLAIRHDMGDDKFYLALDLDIIIGCIPKDYTTSEDFKCFDLLAGHAASIIGFAEDAFIEDVKMLEKIDTGYHWLARGYTARGEYTVALPYFQRSVAICEKIYGTNQIETAGAYNSLGRLYQDIDEFEKAQELLQKAIDIYINMPDAKSSYLATTYTNLGDLFCHLNSDKLSLEMYEKALDIRVKADGMEHPYTATIYDKIACLYRDRFSDGFEKALELHKKAYNIRIETLGYEHPDVAWSCHNMSIYHFIVNNIKKALSLSLFGYSIRLDVMGKEHRDTQKSYNTLLKIYIADGGAEADFKAWLTDALTIDNSDFYISDISEKTFDDIMISYEQAIRDADYPKAFELLPRMESADNRRYNQLINDFKYIFPNKSLEDNEEYWERNKAAIEYKVKLWSLLTSGLPEAQSEIESEDTESATNAMIDENPRQSTETALETTIEKEHPVVKGKRLELSVIELIRELFSIDSEESSRIEKELAEKVAKLTELDRQKAGYQFGFDILFKYNDSVGVECICMIECKDQDKITLAEVAGKLEQACDENQKIHHWILITPNGTLASDLKKRMLVWENSNRWDPIQKVQIWSPANNIDELFALVPHIYKHYFRDRLTGKQFKDKDFEDLEPEKWSSDKRAAIASEWKQKLAHTIPLPHAWQNYLRDHKKLLTATEGVENEREQISEYYDVRYKNRVPILCLDESTEPLNKSVEQYIIDWVYESSHSRLILLGEFGEGKTFLTYSIARYLAEEFRKSPDTGFIPLRMSLREYKEGISAESFLENRLKVFKATLDEWVEIKDKCNVLLILDGFDEMSTGMISNEMARNISRLENCFLYDHFKGKKLKLIITSRTSIFKSERKSLTNLVKPSEVLRFAPINYEMADEHLLLFAEENNVVERYKELRNTHDLMGLSEKALFLDLMKYAMLEGKIEAVNNVTIYNNYANSILERKISIQYGRQNDKKNVDYPDTKEKLMQLLEDFAIICCLYPNEGISLQHMIDNFGKYNDIQFATYLWEHLTPPTDDDSKDAEKRFFNRSLLHETDKEHYLFCHRSMREYFAAMWICRCLRTSPSDFEKYLSKRIELTAQTIAFAGKELGDEDKLPLSEAAEVKEYLSSVIKKTKNTACTDIIRLGTTAINLFYSAWEIVPDIDYSELVLDNAYLPEANFAGKNLINTKLRYATLDNADFCGTDLTDCDLTGVKFEETKEIYSMKVIQEDNGSLYVIYSDGKLRKWDKYSNKPMELASLNIATAANINMSGYGLMLYDIEQVFFTRKVDEDVIGLHGGFNHNKKVTVLDFKRDNILYAANNLLSLYNLESQSIIFENHAITEYTKGIIIEYSSVLLFNDYQGPRFLTIENETIREYDLGKFLDKKVAEDITTISVYQIDEDISRYYICISNKAGNLALYDFKALTASKTNDFTMELIDHYQCGQYVKHTCFLDLQRIVYTGLDGVIHVLLLNEYNELVKELIKGRPRLWQLAIKCNEHTTIDRVKQQEQYEKLKEYCSINDQEDSF